VWSRYLDEAAALFADASDVAFASHHWPTWGRERIVTYLSQQRDLYAYIHDQTLRLMNKGYTGIEIAEMFELPPALERAWHTHGYYGSVSHNVKAVYQRYMGWFDGNPANLWQHPPTERAVRYVQSMGGADAVVAEARRYIDEDSDRRFAAELLNHVVFARPDHAEAKELLADTYTQLGFGAENGTWRNFYLNGAKELRSGVDSRGLTTGAGGEMIFSLSVEQVFDSIAIRIDGPRAWDQTFAIDWHFTDLGERWRTTLSNGVFVSRVEPSPADVDLSLSLTKMQLFGLLAGQGRDEIEIHGDPSVLDQLTGLIDTFDPTFAIVTP
jgi:alkyl sulfatase BDS1-like metallo-beta-lactamase superfamily hydrolase